MFRSMASIVSALSGIVANGHQTMPLISSAPSKIPYGGFSPVRLQTRFMPRPPSRPVPGPLIGRHRSYLRPQRLIRSRTCVQAAPRVSDLNHGSSGPWLPSRLYCPAGSSLTMATSAPLPAIRRLMDYSVGLRVQPASRRGSPIYSASPFTPCRRPYSGGSRVCTPRCLLRGHRPSPSLHRLGNHVSSRSESSEVCVTKLQRSPGGVACPASARAFTTELAWTGSPQTPMSVMTGWLIVIYHHRTFTGWTGSLMGCEQRGTKSARKPVFCVSCAFSWLVCL